MYQILGLEIPKGYSDTVSSIEFELKWDSFYLDAWWSLFFINLYVFGSGTFWVSFINFPKIEDEKNRILLSSLLIFVTCFLEIVDIWSDYKYLMTYMHYNSFVIYFLTLTLFSPFFIALALNYNKPKCVRRTLIQYFQLSKI